MGLWSSRWLRLGEWLLNKRWWLVAVASLSVVTFESIEYHPFLLGFQANFFFELLFYAIILPLSTGLALSWAALTHDELAWSTYYKNLTKNLDAQLLDARSDNDLATVFLQFVRVVIPVVGVVVYKYEQEDQQFKTVLSWSLQNDFPLPKTIFACETDVCPFLPNGKEGKDALTLGLCQDPAVGSSSQSIRYYCLPFLFSNSLMAGARLCFQCDNQPSPEQTRLLKEITPGVAAAFHRVQLERLMKKHEDGLSAEQHRIARDVHDSLGHNLAYLRLRLDQINMEFNQAHMKDTLHHEVEVLRDVAQEAYDQMRDVLTILTLPNDSNFSETLLGYIQRIRQRAKFRLKVNHEGQPRILSAAVRRNCFLIFKETLTNIEKHSLAQSVNIDLKWQDAGFEIDICDDGVGFDLQAEIPKGHFGLKNIRERVLDINAQLEILSSPAHGTRLTLYIPYENRL